MKARRDGLGIAVLLAVISAGNAAQAQIHINIPEDRQPPIYANLDGGGGGFIPHTDVWAVVFFYRPPECVPVDFNLLDFIDRTGAALTTRIQPTVISRAPAPFLRGSCAGRNCKPLLRTAT